MMKLLLTFSTLLISSVLRIQSASAAPQWAALIDCHDVHNNQLVIDIDIQNNQNFQMVIRPSPPGNPNIINYLLENRMVYSQQNYNEIVLPVVHLPYADFGNSDQYMSSFVRLDDNRQSKFNPNTGATFEAIKDGVKISWYFQNCKKSY